MLRAADQAGLHQLTGKVHARNLGMRTLYRKFGFEATHLTMERLGGAAATPAGPAAAEPGHDQVRGLGHRQHAAGRGVPGVRPGPAGTDPVQLGVLRELGRRGIVHALASRNPPAAAEYVSQVTGHGSPPPSAAGAPNPAR